MHVLGIIRFFSCQNNAQRKLLIRLLKMQTANENSASQNQETKEMLKFILQLFP